MHVLTLISHGVSLKSLPVIVTCFPCKKSHLSITEARSLINAQSSWEIKLSILPVSQPSPLQNLAEQSIGNAYHDPALPQFAVDRRTDSFMPILYNMNTVGVGMPRQTN